MIDQADAAEPGARDDAPRGTTRKAEPDSEQQQRGESALTARTITINRKPDEVYAFWRDFSNLAGVMENIEAITVRDDRTSHWVVNAPGGRTVEWDAIVTEDEPGRLIAWQSAEGADVSNSGRVAFRDAGERGTFVTATLAYDPPAGVVGKLVAKLFQKEPGIQQRRDLRRIKQFLETGEIATSSPPNPAPKA
ncbi:SRPBCC family protein [Sphingomonas solaris]|uniref:SRPBCC family protein n=1 Tax=Alterirhizorhabdus solaris TaxID=2529389 RepID=A0A558QRX3_9SPHN|nr:SRPBCC family protein [Sphingomonas solaris]TVV69888.1 SRPBCC family protein [Sphingomonas solaris]